MTEKETKQEGIDPKKMKDGTMSFLDHLDELRSRLIRYVIVLGLCILATYFYRKEILDLIRRPVDAPLKKYTAVSRTPASKQPGLVGGPGDYNCVCHEAPSMNSISTESPGKEAVTADKSPGKEVVAVKTADATADSPADLSESISKNLDKAGNILHQIGSTLDDFIIFFQVMLGKEPSPVFTDRAPPERGPAQSVSSRTAVPGTIQLDCRCTVSQPVPATGSTMVYIGLPELFFAQMKVAIFAGFFISFPYLLIQIWGFIGPALYSGEKKVFWIFSIFSYLFFIGGALFGYFVVFPFGFDFFLSLTQLGEIMPSLSVGEYLGFAIKLLLAFGFIFEMPLATFILARMGIVTPKIMIGQARVAVLIVFILSAVLTPPDPFTMMLMAGPLLMLYIISIGVCFIGQNKQKAALRAQGIELDDDE